MKLQGKWLWRGALTLLALALAWLWLRPTPVTTLTLAAQPVQRSVVATGRVEAIRESVLGSTVTARVVATPVKQGAHVAAGATLLLLESDELLALRAQAEAQLRDADSQLSEARRQWQRQQALFAQGFISQAALDAARRTLDAAEQRQAQTRGALAQSQAKLEQMTVRAPADGVLLTRAVEAGDVVTAGKTLLRFASDGPRRVLLDLDERDLGKVALGQTTAVREGRAALLEDGRVRWVKISTDERIAGQLPVTAGLSAGQQVIVPAPLLDDGARVKAQP